MRLPRDLPKDVVAMAAVALCVALGFGIVAPAIPLLAKQFGVSATAAGAVVSAFALMRLFSDLGAGKAVDRLGERTGLALGIGVVAVSSLFAGLAQNYPQLLILRGVGGVGSAVFGVSAVALVLRVAKRRMRARAMSVYRSGFLIGGIVGPAVGGAVVGISYRAPFFLYTGTLVVAGTVALVFVSHQRRARPAAADQTDSRPEPHDEEEAKPEPTLRSALRTREYQAALVANFAVGLSIFGLRTAVVPLLIVEGLDAEPVWVFVGFLIAALAETAMLYPAGHWADVAGRRPALATGASVAAAGLLLLGFSTTLPLALVGMGVFGAGSAFLGSVPGALVGDVAGKRSGTVVAVFKMASDFGAVVGPVLGGLLVDKGSFAAAFGLAAAAVAAAGLAGLRIREPRRSRPEMSSPADEHG